LQVVTYVEALTAGKAAAGPTSAPEPESCWDQGEAEARTRPSPIFVSRSPDHAQITVKDLPQPYATDSAENGAQLTARPESAWSCSRRFKVELFASRLRESALAAYRANGDVFLAETHPGRIRVFRGMTADGKPSRCRFREWLDPAFNEIAFIRRGRAAVESTSATPNEVLRFPYHNGDLKRPAHRSTSRSADGGIRRVRSNFLRMARRCLWEWVPRPNVDDTDYDRGGEESPPTFSL